MLFIHQDLQGDLKTLIMGLASFDSSAQIVVASGSSYLVKQNAWTRCRDDVEEEEGEESLACVVKIAEGGEL